MHFLLNPKNWYEISARSNYRKVLWWYGYHFCLTRRRSPVQAWTASRQVFDKMKFFYLIKIKIKHFLSSQSIWYEITAQRTNRKVLCCNGYHFCLTRRGSEAQARQHQGKFLTNWGFYLSQFKIMHFISGQANIWIENTAQSTNRKVLWWKGYHFFLTRRGSPVQAWTASSKFFQKMMSLLD